MAGFMLIFYIVLTALIQILINFVIFYLLSSEDNRNTKLLRNISVTLNISCFLCSLYLVLKFLKIFLIPEIIEIFTTVQGLI